MTVAASLESKDKKIAVITSMGLAVLTWVILHLLGFKVPMPPTAESLKYKDAEIEFIPLEEILPEGTAGGGGSGMPDQSELVDQYTPQMQEILNQENSDVHVSSGSSNKTNTNKPTNNKPSTTEQDDNPFGPGGSGGGADGGRGGSTGTDTGDGKGKGDGGKGSGAANRYLVRQPNASSIVSDEKCTIAFVVVINADGEIVGYPTWDREHSTTDNPTLVKKVAALIKEQARYNAEKDASNVKKPISVNLKPL